NLIRVMPAKGQDMQTSIFLAKLIGPFALALGLALLVNGSTFRTLANEFLASPALIFLSGVITLPAGLAIVLTHNVWTADWRVLITLLGWLAVIAGFIRMIVPQRAASIGRSAVANPLTPKIGGAIYCAIGLALCYFGYRH
ncbi:MAG: hypothetical protein ACREDY_15885, partial [Bradyrhizobium sp.]